MASGSNGANHRIVQVIAPAKFGGAESVVRSLTEELRHLGHEVLVVALTPHSAEHPWTSLLRDAGLPVRSIVAGLKGYGEEMRQLRAVLDEFGATVVHSHGYRADIAAMRARGSRTAWVSTVHGFTHISWRATLYQVIDRLALTRADRVIAVASHIVPQLSRFGVSRRRIAVVRNAFRPGEPVSRDIARATLGLAPEATVAGWVGRLSVEKGPDQLIDALRRVSEPLDVVVIGDGPEREALEASIGTLPPNIRVRLMGARSDAATLMKAFDVLLLTSRTEGMPLVVLEAMAAGVPVVSFNVGDVSRAVSTETGWLVPPTDTEQFAAQLRQAIAPTIDRDRFRVATSQRIATEFAADHWAEAHVAVYDHALAHHRAS